MNPNAFRIACAVAAVAVLCWPYMGRAVEIARGILSRATPQPIALNSGASDSDLSLVLGLAARLSKAGCAEGVALCQKLIDVLLRPAK